MFLIQIFVYLSYAYVAVIPLKCTDYSLKLQYFITTQLTALMGPWIQSNHALQKLGCSNIFFIFFGWSLREIWYIFPARFSFWVIFQGINTSGFLNVWNCFLNSPHCPSTCECCFLCSLFHTSSTATIRTLSQMYKT